MVSYLKRVGIAISVLFNVLLCGSSNQSFSARNYGWKKDGKPNLVWLIDLVARYVFKDHGHCLEAWAYWYTRKHLTDPVSNFINTKNITTKIDGEIL